MGALHQAKPIFAHENFEIKLISFRNIAPNEQIPKILEEFMDSFEVQYLQKNNATAKNYSLFSIVCLKIVKTLDEGKKRGLVSAHVLNKLDKMFVKYPVKYSKQAVYDPLGIIFAVTELALDAENNLAKPYQFDQTILNSIAPLVQRYYLEFDQPAAEILQELSDMPKSRLVITFGPKHKEIIEKFLQYAIVRLPLEVQIKRAKNLLEKIVDEENDSISLEYYNTLKLFIKENNIRPHISQIAKQMNTNKRFAKTILDEISKL